MGLKLYGKCGRKNKSQPSNDGGKLVPLCLAT